MGVWENEITQRQGQSVERREQREEWLMCSFRFVKPSGER